MSDAFAPSQWIEVIKDARPSQPFHVVRIKNEDFKTFDELLNLVPRPNTLKITENCLYYLNIDEPHLIRSKKSHNDIEWDVYIIREATEDRTFVRNRPIWNSVAALEQFVAPRKYRGKF